MSALKKLRAFGLSENEAQVYIACLELGPESVQHIAERAGLNRVTVYGILEALLQKGYVQEEQHKGKRRIAAYSPTKLYDVITREYDVLKKKEKSIDALVTELKALEHRPARNTNVIYYEGEEGLKNWASAALETKGELLEWTKIESFSKPFDAYLSSYYFPEKATRKIPTRFIFLDTPEARAYVRERYLQPGAPPMRARFIPKEQFETPGFMVIFNDRYSIAIPSEMRAVTVEDSLIADTQRKIFEFGWMHATDEVTNQ